MPKVFLKQSFVDNPPLPTDKPKIQYFDEKLTGFILEVRRNGKATYYIRYRDKHSRTRQLMIGPSDALSIDQARERARALKSQVVMGFDPLAHVEKIKKTPTFREFTRDKYLPHVKTYKRSWEYDQDLIEKRMLKLWGNMRMDEFKPGDLLEFQSALVNRGFKPGSVNRVMALVKHIFNLAERWEIIQRAPTKNVSKLADNGAMERFLTHQELETLLEAIKTCKSPVVPDLIEFLILTGARKSEASQLPWSEIDMEEHIWTLPPERNKGKTRKIIPLSQGAMKILKRRAGNGSDYVFPNPDTGLPMKHMHGTWDRIRRNAGLPDVRVHDLRHSYASFLVNSGRSLYEVQKLLGHADISTTQRYAHLTKDTLQEATEIVSKLVR
ncbi:site-specific integrase [Desulfonatronovibrio magnus]|uniref:site-specific integrase n=1 Tax=Desulfonatronovibrio magnus TaxID=698827 RepID=UPI0005EB4671|nr:site-specific integrase [Desulfonatronovibrio magnus]